MRQVTDPSLLRMQLPAAVLKGGSNPPGMQVQLYIMSPSGRILDLLFDRTRRRVTQTQGTSLLGFFDGPILTHLEHDRELCAAFLA